MKELNKVCILTDPEIVVISLLNDGLSYDEIAKTINVSIHVTKYMMKTIFSKLEVHTRTDACNKFYKKNLYKE
jgi:ATP/maltotriose-dependent transcriptional regulator MalT